MTDEPTTEPADAPDGIHGELAPDPVRPETSPSPLPAREAVAQLLREHFGDEQTALWDMELVDQIVAAVRNDDPIASTCEALGKAIWAKLTDLPWTTTGAHMTMLEPSDRVLLEGVQGRDVYWMSTGGSGMQIDHARCAEQTFEPNPSYLGFHVTDDDGGLIQRLVNRESTGDPETPGFDEVVDAAVSAFINTITGAVSSLHAEGGRGRPKVTLSALQLKAGTETFGWTDHVMGRIRATATLVKP